jgi:hypothetical protein
MRKRQFGEGKLIDAASLNTAQNYSELNAKEIAEDSRIKGVISGCSVIPDPVSTHTIIITSSVLRTQVGERIVIPYNLNLILEPTTVVTSTGEFWLTVFVDYDYNKTLPDTDTDGVSYYKQYDNWFVISIEEGVVSSTGSAVKPTNSSTGLIICDILYNSALVSTGLITLSDIDTSRQEHNSNHYHNNFNQLEVITDGLHDSRTTNPHSVTKTQVGLGNVTNNAQVIKIDNSTTGNIPTWATSTGDYLTSVGYSIENNLIGSTTAIANSHAIKTYIDDVLSLKDSFIYKGEIDCSINPNYPAGNTGDLYEITSSGLIGGISGKVTSTGDIIICLDDDVPSGNEASVGEFWIIIQGKNNIYVTGADKATFGEIAKFIDTSGRKLTSSGFIAQDATTYQIGLVQLSDSYIGTSSGLAVTEKALSDGLAQFSNVTNDAQLKRESEDYITFGYKEFPIGTDIILVETSSTGLITSTGKYKLQLNSITISEDINAIHKTSTGELYTLTEKFVLVDDDEFLIEDSDDSYIKKKILLSSLIDKFYVPPTKTIHISSTGDIGELSITSTGIKLISITSNLDYLNSYPSNNNTWETTGSLNTARLTLAGAGVQDAALSFGGIDELSFSSAVTEKFNGSTWVATGSLNTDVVGLAGCGIQSSALSFGGEKGTPSAITEKFNGSTWSTDAGWNLNTARSYLAGCGTQNAGLSFGGSTGSDSVVTEKFNGLTWSTAGGWDLNTAISYLAGCGVQSSALSFGGYISTWSAISEKFNGSTWTATGNLNTARYGLAGCGTQNAGLSFGGNNASYLETVEKYNGSTWVVTGSLNTARLASAGSGVQNSGLSIGGSTGAASTITEKFNEGYKLKLNIVALENTTDNTAVTKREISTHESNCSFKIKCPAVISYGILCERIFSTLSSTGLATSAGITFLNYGYWEATGDLNTARRGLAGSGTQNAGLSFGGDTGAISAVTEKFNGSTWTATGDLNTARSSLSGCGTQNSGLSFGGSTGSPSAVTEKFNGSTWVASGNLNTARYGLAGSGTQNAGLSFGGSTGSDSVVTEKFNGLTWVASGNLNTARYGLAGSGTQNAGLSFGGNTGAVSGISEKFNGSTWSNSGSLNTARRYLAGSGTQNAGLSFGGNTGSYSAITEKFNGSTWVATEDLNTARYGLAGSGTQNSGLSFGGDTGSYSAITEKFNYNADISELYSTVDCYVDKSNIVIEY